MQEKLVDKLAKLTLHFWATMVSSCGTWSVLVLNQMAVVNNNDSVITGLPIGYSVIVALTGLPIGYSVIVALTSLPIGYSVIVALTGPSIVYSGSCSNGYISNITFSSSLLSPTTYLLSERHLILFKASVQCIYYKEGSTYRKCRVFPQCQMDNE